MNGISPTSKMANSILQRVHGAAKKERWGLSIVKIAWTAGPVTYLALQGGYLLAYREAAPTRLVIYFAGYTVFAGLFALLIRFFYNATWGSENEEERLSLERIFSRLPDRIIEIRNLQLVSLDLYGRRVLGAKYILENPDAGAESVATALMDLTGDSRVAATMRDVEVYRKHGLPARAEDKSNEVKAMLHEYTSKLGEASQEVNRLVWQRASGLAPSKRQGRPRTRGFLGRVFTAGESDNLDLMSLADAEELCVLAYELICNRRFSYVKVAYHGDKEYRDAARRLAKCRREYRSAVFVRNSRLRVLAEQLYSAGPSPGHISSRTHSNFEGIRRIIASQPQIRSARLLQQLVVDAMASYLEKPTGAAGSKRGSTEMKKTNRILELYKQLQKAALRTDRAYENLKKAWKHSADVMRSRVDTTPIRLLRAGDSGRGIRIRLNTIGLETRKIMTIARLIESKLEEFGLEHEERGVKSHDQKELAVDLLQILDRFIPLSEPGVQRAIESSNSAYMTGIDPSMTSAAKQTWGLALVSEVDSSKQTGIHETIRSLVQYDRLEILEADINYLVKNFAADPDYLRGLMALEGVSLNQELDIPPPPPVPTLKS
ncbi:MAG: hypothetical protein P1P77_09075 [Spirochaetaceae bacterium]|nr:hypothetical protein [Spirochaetaceae bacterium]